MGQEKSVCVCAGVCVTERQEDKIKEFKEKSLAPCFPFSQHSIFGGGGGGFECLVHSLRGFLEHYARNNI